MADELYRGFYADEIRIAAGLDAGPLREAFARVPRDKFMGEPPWRIISGDRAALRFLGIGEGKGYLTTHEPKDLYHNVLVALDPDRQLNNGQPSALASWISTLELKTGDRLYHLGCGVGYYTAIMAEVVGGSGKITASEVDERLAARARDNLSVYPNVLVHSGDGAAFDPGECDAIFINAGVTHPHPIWLERLCVGGRLVFPLTSSTDGANNGTGVVARITRVEGGYSAKVVSLAGIYSCTSVRDPEMNAALAKAFAAKSLFKLKSVRTDPHEAQETCLTHGAGVCLSTVDLWSLNGA